MNTVLSQTLQTVRDALNTTFEDTKPWFDKPEALRTYKPANGGWSINEVLEHITLTSYFLLILIKKGRDKALKNVNNLILQDELADYQFASPALEEIALYQSFDWIRPEHMEPKGEKTLSEVRELMESQLNECLSILDELKNGEGILYKTTMTVNNLGKIDVYQYIYFLALHARRHITQMEKIEKEYITL